MNIAVGIIGLGRMGAAIGYRLKKAGIVVHGFDPSPAARNAAQQEGIVICDDLKALAKAANVVWLMVPAGPLVDDIVQQLVPHLTKGATIIDGGNSHFTDSIRRYDQLTKSSIYFIDCGTSGGIRGRDDGFCLMIGGDKTVYNTLEPLWQAVAAPQGYDYVGPAGAGHYVKMVHNGIEYALMQSYADGIQLLHKNKTFSALDLARITKLWDHGSIIRSFLLQLVGQILEKDADLSTVSGYVAESGMGNWTSVDAQKNTIPVPMIDLALEIRAKSRETGGDYATKIVALLRQEFGGHAIKYNKENL